MKILAIGDPHGDLEKVKQIPLSDADLILLTGDLGKADLARSRFFANIERKRLGYPELKVSSSYRKREYMETYNSAMELVRYLSRFAPVYAIFGNADSTNSEVRKRVAKISSPLPFLYNDLNSIPNVQVINNRLANFKGVRVGGLEYFIDESWVKEFEPPDYKKKMQEATRDTEKAKRIIGRYGNADILLCHQPPYGVLDESRFKGAPANWYGKHAGSKVILDYIKKYQPKYVFCGHIHEGEGKAMIGKTQVYNLGVAGHKFISL